MQLINPHPALRATLSRNQERELRDINIIGFTLLEVLIALLILSIGLLGFAKAELIAFRHTEDAYLQSIAEAQLNSLADNLYACQTTNYSTSCISSEVNNWKINNTALLPQAKSDIRINSFDYSLTIKWRELATATNKNLAKLVIRL